MTTIPPLWRRLRTPTLLAMTIIFVFVAGVVTWSSKAPLTSAAVASGFVGIEARRKTVQHLEGGIIAEILVSEGDKVKAGDVLIRMDDTIARSAFTLLEGQYISQYALSLRLHAEQQAAGDITLPDDTPQIRSRERLLEAFNLQRAVFHSRKNALENRRRIITSKNERLRQQISSLQAEIKELVIQKELIELELASVRKIVEQGLEKVSRLYAMQRAAANIERQLARLRGSIAEAEIAIGQAELELVDLDSNFLNQVTGELTNLTNQMADMEPRLAAARNKLDRMDVVAPVAGTIISLSQHTVGGVLGAGQPILDIVPEDSGLLIEAQVSLSEIDVVRPGLPAEVRLTAFSARTTPTVPGTVVYVSGDRLWDETTRGFYYAIHVRLNPGQSPENGVDLRELYPGMPVDVMIVTGKRTVLDYFLQPLTDVIARALRE